MNADNSIAREVPRRTLLCGLGLIAIGMLPSSALALGNVKVLSNGKIEILLSKNTALRKVGGVIQFTDNQGKSIALIRTSRAVSGEPTTSMDTPSIPASFIRSAPSSSVKPV